MNKSIAAVLGFALIPAVHGEIIHVSEGQSIQTAVECALDGDTVLVHDGSYAATVVLYGKTLCLGSLFLLDQDTSHVANTVVAPDYGRPDTGSCFVYAYGETVGSRLVGMTLTSGTGTTWSPVGNPLGGGAVFVRGSRLSLERCNIRQSTAVYGGGLLVVSDVASDSASCVVRECFFQNCSASAYGGAICVYHAALYGHDTVFLGNSTESSQSGGAIDALPSVMELDACVFVGNVSGSGAVFAGLGMNRITNCRFSQNLSFGGLALCDLQMVACDGLVAGCLFGNSVTPFNGVMISEYEVGRRIDFVGNVIRGFSALSAEGALVLYNHSAGHIAYNIIADNSNTLLGAVFVWQGIRRLHHNVFLGNQHTGTGASGSAIYVQRSEHDSLVVDSNIFVGNLSPAITSNFDIGGTRHPVHVENNWWGDHTGPHHPVLNPGGQGDTILQDSIYFIPWLTEPPDTTMPEGYLATSRDPVAIPRTWELLDVYPNPFNQSVTLIIAGFASGDFEINLYNLLGQVVDVVHRGPLTGGQLSYTAPPWLSSGVYLLAAHDKHSVQTRKVVLLK